MKTEHFRVLRFAGALRAKGHTAPEEILVAEWKAVDRAKVAASRRLTLAIEPLLLEAIRRAAETWGDGGPPLGAALALDDLSGAIDVVLPEATATALRAGFASGSVRTGVRLPFDADAPAVRREVARLVGLARTIPETLAARVDTVIRHAMAESLTGAEVGRRVLEAAPHLTAAQAQVVGRTTATAAFEAGQMEAYGRAGVATKRWLTQRDDRVRSEHAALDGEEVPLAAAFSNGQEYPQGYNCRCTTLPILSRVEGKAAPAAKTRPWLAERNARIVAAYPGLRDARGREVALCEIGEREGLSPDRVWAIWKARRRSMSAH